jgi:DNA polymerase
LYLSNEPAPLPEPKPEKKGTVAKGKLDAYNQSICTCQECPLGKTRTNFVFGVGDPNADLLLVGEAPGEQEDLKGEPFVGRAGKMLDKILYAIDRKRGDGVYIANVIKCRPPNNRDPLPSEVKKCEPYLTEQISQIQPKLIVALGRVAGKTLLKMDVPLKEMRDKTHDYNGTPLRVTFHPAALLRNSNFKKPAWIDFQWIRDYLQNA